MAVRPYPCIAYMVRVLCACALVLLLHACSNVQRSSARADRPATNSKQMSGATATLTYTATNLNHGAQGTPIGKGSLHYYPKEDFCTPAASTEGEIQQVSEQQPEVTVTIPAGQPLVIEAFWSGARLHCLLGNRAFLAKPGVHYRMTTQVDMTTGACLLWVQRHTPAGNLLDLGQLQTLDQICPDQG